MKLVVELKYPNLIEEFSNIEGFILNIKGLSCYYDRGYSLGEIEELIRKIHNNNQLVYVNARRIFHEQDLEIIDEMLDKLIILGVDYFFYGDATFYEIAVKKNIVEKLIYQVNTYMTNYFDISVMLSENESVVSSTEISYEELKNITDKVVEPIYIHAFGYYPIFHSRRELITNYQMYRQIEVDTSCNYDVVEELRDSHYPIEQTENGMVVYIDGAYCLDKEINSLGGNNYFIITSKFINENDYKEIINIYINEEYDKLSSLDIIYTKGLLYEKSKLLKKEGGASCE